MSAFNIHEFVNENTSKRTFNRFFKLQNLIGNSIDEITLILFI